MKIESKELQFNFVTLSELLKAVKDSGLPEEEYHNVDFRYDYTYCYYEGDEPTLIAHWSKNKFN